MIFTYLTFWILIVSIISVITIIIAISIKQAELIMLAFLISSFVIGMGWGVLGNLGAAIRLERPVNCSVIKTPSNLMLTVDDKPVYYITDKVNYDKYQNAATVELMQSGYVNIYEKTNWLEDYKLK